MSLLEGNPKDPVASGGDQANTGQIHRTDWGSGPGCLGFHTSPLQICLIPDQVKAFTAPLRGGQFSA